jgi:hypothetical protein
MAFMAFIKLAHSSEALHVKHLSEGGPRVERAQNLFVQQEVLLLVDEREVRHAQQTNRLVAQQGASACIPLRKKGGALFILHLAVNRVAWQPFSAATGALDGKELFH